MSILRQIVGYIFSSDTEINDMKTLTSGKPVKKAKLPERVVVYLSQHVGKEAECCVNIGDSVKEGQLIGKPSGPVSANIHAPVSGRITEIKKYRMPTGTKTIGIMIEGNGKEKAWIKTDSAKVEKLSSEQIIEKIEDFGIVGMGGATFPTHFKIRSGVKSGVKHYILNGAECEPYITADHRIMVEKHKEILSGIMLLMKATGVKRVSIGIEKNKKDAIMIFRDMVADYDSIDLFELKSLYPQGAEKELIKSVTGEEVPAGGLPSDVSVIVNNIGTAFAVYEAIFYDKPLIERVVTVTGDGIKNPGNLLARIGTPVRDLIKECGGYKTGVSKIIMGGPMMGFAQADDNIYITKGTSCILVMKDDKDYGDEKPCIRCGRCVDACPMKLNPYLISAYSEKDRFDDAKDAGVLNCYECGKCAYVCPVRRPMTQYMKYAKSGIEKTEAKDK